jgi:hypothetical protein
VSKTTGYILKSTKPDGPVFEILKYDAESKMGTLFGAMGVEFKESLDKERLKKYGYKIMPKPVEVPDGEPEGI